jgi:hypothetical protein
MKTFFEIRLIKNLIILVLSALVLFLFIESIAVVSDIGIKKESFMPSKVITIRGVGEALATPNIATFSFTVREEDKDVAIAQQKSSDKANKAISYLKEKGIEDKDIKTESYNTNPKYDYSGRVVCPLGYCPPVKPVLTGYEVSESVSVKVRDVSKAGELLAGIANISIGEVSGLSLTVDSPEAIKAIAKADAIAKAKIEAEATAKNLGVRLGRVVGFYEENSSDGYPVSSGGPMMMKASVDSVPNIQTGEQKITSTVSVTYEVM